MLGDDEHLANRHGDVRAERRQGHGQRRGERTRERPLACWRDLCANMLEECSSRDQHPSVGDRGKGLAVRGMERLRPQVRVPGLAEERDRRSHNRLNRFASDSRVSLALTGGGDRQTSDRLTR